MDDDNLICWGYNTEGQPGHAVKAEELSAPPQNAVDLGTNPMGRNP